MDTVKRVYELLDERKMSLCKLARMSGLNYSTIKTTERRNGQLSVDTIERICHAMGITLAEFFADTERMDHAGTKVDQGLCGRQR